MQQLYNDLTIWLIKFAAVSIVVLLGCKLMLHSWSSRPVVKPRTTVDEDHPEIG